jgi:hypothetical protein
VDHSASEEGKQRGLLNVGTTYHTGSSEIQFIPMNIENTRIAERITKGHQVFFLFDVQHTSVVLRVVSNDNI